MKTSNGGQSWEIQLSPAVVRDFFFFDGEHGYAVGGRSIVKTMDGGATWVDVSSGDDRIKDLRAAYFFDESTGWVVGLGHEIEEESKTIQKSVLLETRDGGSTWSIQEFSYDTSLLDEESVTPE